MISRRQFKNPVVSFTPTAGTPNLTINNANHKQYRGSVLHVEQGVNSEIIFANDLPRGFFCEVFRVSTNTVTIKGDGTNTVRQPSKAASTSGTLAMEDQSSVAIEVPDSPGGAGNLRLSQLGGGAATTGVQKVTSFSRDPLPTDTGYDEGTQWVASGSGRTWELATINRTNELVNTLDNPSANIVDIPSTNGTTQSFDSPATASTLESVTIAVVSEQEAGTAANLEIRLKQGISTISTVNVSGVEADDETLVTAIFPSVTLTPSTTYTIQVKRTNSGRKLHWILTDNTYGAGQSSFGADRDFKLVLQVAGTTFTPVAQWVPISTDRNDDHKMWDTERQKSTSLISGGVVTGVVGTNTFDVSAGTGKIVEVDTNGNVNTKYISWNDWIGVNVSAFAGTQLTSIKFNTSAGLSQSGGLLDSTGMSFSVWVAVIERDGSDNILSITPRRPDDYRPKQAFRDMADAIGVVRYEGVEMTIDGTGACTQAAGKIGGLAANAPFSGAPSEYIASIPTITSRNVATFGAQCALVSTQATLRTDQYDNAGTATAIPAGKYGASYIVWSQSASVFIQYISDEVWNSMDEAIDGVNSKDFPLTDYARRSGLLQERVIYLNGTVNYNNPDEFRKFGGVNFGCKVQRSVTKDGSASGDATIEKVTQTAHGLTVKDLVHHNGTQWVKSQANADATVAQGMVYSVPDANTFHVCTHGKITIAGHGFTTNNYYWLSQTTAGAVDINTPTGGIAQSVFHVRDANTILVDIEQPITIEGTLNESLHHFYGYDSNAVTFKNSYLDFSSVETLNDPNALGVTDASGDYVEIKKSGRYTVRFELKHNSWNSSNTWLRLHKNNSPIYTTILVQETTAGSTETLTKQEINLPLDLIAGDTLKFYASPTTSMQDCVVEVRELPTKTCIPASALPTSDQATSGYVDIGNMRMQWGRFTTGVSGYVTLTLPAAFKDTAYNFVAGGANGDEVDLVQQNTDATRTTTSLQIRFVDDNSVQVGGTCDWQAIGLKP